MTAHERYLPNVERHEDEQPSCAGQWCCGCAAHPIGKPWGWNHEAWARHNAAVHQETKGRAA